jgi:hypothetical protein
MNKKMTLTVFALTAIFSSGIANASSRQTSLQLDDVSCVSPSVDRSNCLPTVDSSKLDYAFKVTCSTSFEAILNDANHTHVTRAATYVVISDRLTFKTPEPFHKAEIATRERAYVKDGNEGFGKIIDALNAKPKCLATNPAPAPDVIDPTPAAGEAAPGAAAAAQ